MQNFFYRIVSLNIFRFDKVSIRSFPEIVFVIMKTRLWLIFDFS